MAKFYKQLETRVARTYRGGKLLEEFLGKPNPKDSNYPEDWISSFVEAKNRIPVKNEGLSRVMTEDGEKLITEVVTANDFGAGRNESGVLIKYLDSAERLGIQAHPTNAFAQKYFGTPYGKTECWHILNVRDDGDEPASVYIGFKEHVTKEYFKMLFEKQDVEGLLNCLHKFTVKKGDTVLVRGGLPHAINAGCFLLEIQEPTDYTFRVERVTLAGETVTDKQMHYGIGFEAMLDCFDYTPRTRRETEELCFLKPREAVKSGGKITTLADYSDTPCFKLEKISADEMTVRFDSFVTLIALNDNGKITCGESSAVLHTSDKYFIPFTDDEIKLENAEVLVCYPPKK